MNYDIVETVEYDILDYEDLLDIYYERKFEEGKTGVKNENYFTEDRENFPVYKKVFKRTYGDLFEVELSAFYKEENYKDPIMGIVDVKSIEDIDIKFSPVAFAEFESEGNNYYFSRTFILMDKEDVDKRIKAAVEKFRFEEKDTSYILPVNLFLIDGIGK